MHVVTLDRPIFTRFHAIFAMACVLLASLSGLGCSSSSNDAPAAPAENYADNEGDDDDGGVVIDAGADDTDAAPPKTPGKANDDGGCPMLTFPSGVNIQTKTDSALTAEYTGISDTVDYPLPVCFIDTDDLYDPVTGDMNTIDVMVGAHFALSELVSTELPYGHKVLVSPTLVAKLDAYRDALGDAVDLTSGYRSPAHQRATCQSICGMDSCGDTCAARSRHSWGDAADHGVVPSAVYADAGCKAKFNFVFREGNHMHLDLNPEHPICTVDIL
jgi:hypothetical protein